MFEKVQASGVGRAAVPILVVVGTPLKALPVREASSVPPPNSRQRPVAVMTSPRA